MPMSSLCILLSMVSDQESVMIGYELPRQFRVSMVALSEKVNLKSHRHTNPNNGYKNFISNSMNTNRGHETLFYGFALLHL